MRAHMNAGKIGDTEKPMLVRLLQYKYPSSTAYMPDLDVISEAMGHMYALRPDHLLWIMLIMLIPGLLRPIRHLSPSPTSSGSSVVGLIS